MIEIKVPSVGESISEVTLLQWIKKDGEYVDRDEVIAELESEKATFEVNAEKAGVLKVSAKEGDTLKIGDTLATIDEAAAKPEKAASTVSAATATQNSKSSEPPKMAAAEVVKEQPKQNMQPGSNGSSADIKASPVASAIIADKKVDPKNIQPSGYNGKI